MREPLLVPAPPESFVRKPPPGKPRIPLALLQLLGILGVLVLVASIPIWTIVSTWLDHQALKDEWKIAGPACAVPTQAWPEGGRRPKVFRYKGARFERRYGGAYCVAVPDPGLFAKTTHAVCQFPAPGLLTVTTARGTRTWQPAIGRNATVTIRDGAASCVVGGWWR